MGEYILKRIIRILVRALFIFPVKNGRILFVAFEGEKISDNPKCVYDFLERQATDKMEFIWVYNGENKNPDLPGNVRIIKKRSFQRFFYMATAQVIVDNYPPSVLVPSRKKQLYIETWHAGGAYKRIGNAYQTKKQTEKRMTDLAMRAVKIFVSSSKVFTQTNIKEGYQYAGEVLNCGMPRNDIFFDGEAVEAAANKVRAYYSLKTPIVVYAPTFRGEIDHTDALNVELDTEKLGEALKARYGEDAAVLVRHHYLDRHNYNFGDHVTDAGDYPDMQELLCAADILITDYSSSMWDFALLGRSCFLYTPDIDQYIRDRGVFTPPEQWPGMICRSMDELCDKIKNIEEDACAAKAKRHLDFMGSYETGHATEMISNRIVDYTNGD